MRRHPRRVQPSPGVPPVFQRIALILGIVVFAGVASAEPQGRPYPQPKPAAGLFPIGGLAGGLVAPRPR